MALPVMVGFLLVVALLGGSPAPSEADGVKIIIGGAHTLHAGHHRPHFQGQRLDPHKLHGHPHGHLFVVPSHRWVPGYWTYQWVPQSYIYHVWVPGHWSPEGTWVEGHYEPQTAQTGYYRPVWVGGYWVTW